MGAGAAAGVLVVRIVKRVVGVAGGVLVQDPGRLRGLLALTGPAPGESQIAGSVSEVVVPAIEDHLLIGPAGPALIVDGAGVGGGRCLAEADAVDGADVPQRPLAALGGDFELGEAVLGEVDCGHACAALTTWSRAALAQGRSAARCWAWARSSCVTSIRGKSWAGRSVVRSSRRAAVRVVQ